MTEPVVQRFSATSGRLIGPLGLITAGVVLVLTFLDWDTGAPLGVAILAVLGGVLVWAALMRPALWTTTDDLVMRGMLHTDRVPLASIDEVVVTQVLTVRVGEKSYVSPVVGYTVRQAVQSRKRPRGAETPKVDPSHVPQRFVEDRLTFLAQDARDRHAPAGDVRRTWAWPEIAVCSGLLLAFVVWLLVH